MRPTSSVCTESVETVRTTSSVCTESVETVRTTSSVCRDWDVRLVHGSLSQGRVCVCVCVCVCGGML